MASVNDVAKGFSISGLLDASSRVRERHPVHEIPVEEIADHPANAAYSMDPEGIRALAESIRERGLTDLPLVRKAPDGSWQMISGHRRKAAYALLAQKDPAYQAMPCRVVSGITDEQAVALLHTANLFTRSLNPLERAAATRALGIQVEAMRGADPALAGERTEDIKAAIITAQTGHAVSGKTIRRQESLAAMIEEKLDLSWKAAALSEEIPAEAVRILCRLPEARQRELWAKWHADPTPKSKVASWLRAAIAPDGPDPRLAKAEQMIRAWAREHAKAPSAADSEALARISDLSRV